MNVLVTGGAGYIGSHTCIELLNAGYNVVVFDNFSNSHMEALRRVEKIARKQIVIIEGDIRDEAALSRAMEDNRCDAVVHFAGLKAVGESVQKPLEYYDNNVAGTLNLLRAMRGLGVRKMVFSSSATVYGEPQYLPLTEDHPLSVANPYGRTKLIVEEMLRDVFHADPEWQIGILRYFNPVGAHESGEIGEDPQGIPSNLMPFIAQVASGKLEKLNVWGSDYPTPDGTGVRDYIHVVDLALGHVKVLQKLDRPQCFEVNLGTGIGYSVLEIIRAFEKAAAMTIPFEIKARRLGDVASCYADTEYAKSLLDWEARRGIDEMCIDHWRWQKNNPEGYA